MPGRPNAILFLAEGPGKRVWVRQRRELDAVLPHDKEGLTFLPLGASGAVLYMQRSAQGNSTEPVNYSASLVASRVLGHSVTLRGDVVSFPTGEPWA
jgi:hypothetical protein